MAVEDIDLDIESFVGHVAFVGMVVVAGAVFAGDVVVVGDASIVADVVVVAAVDTGDIVAVPGEDWAAEASLKRRLLHMIHQ